MEKTLPPGMTITAQVKCLKADGKRSLREIAARAEVEVIGQGRHERIIVNQKKFSARVAAKARKQ